MSTAVGYSALGVESCTNFLIPAASTY